MYKMIQKDEMLVIMLTGGIAIAYRLLHKYELIPDGVMLIICMLAAAYLFFNRVVKLMIDRSKMKGDSYDTFFTIEDIVRVKMGRGSYNAFTVRYEDEEHKEHVKDIHSAFSIRRWKVGDRVRIKVSRSDPEKIIIPSSDIFLAVLMSLLGIAAETAVIAVYVNIALKNM